MSTKRGLARLYGRTAAASAVGTVVGGVLATVIALALAAGGKEARGIAETALAFGVVLTCVWLARATATFAGFASAVLIGVLFLLPVDFLPIHRDIVALRIDPVLLCAVIGLLGTAAAGVESRLWPLLLTFAVLALGALSFSVSPGTSERFFFLSFVVVGSAVFLAVWRGSRLVRDVQILARVVMWSGALAAVLGIVEFLLRRNPIYGSFYPAAGPHSNGAVYFSGTGALRITTSIGHPLDAGALLSVALIVTLGVTLTSGCARERHLSILIAGLIFVAVIMTKSRTDLVLAPLGAALLILLSTRSRAFARPRHLVAKSRFLPVTLVVLLGVGLFTTRGIWLERFSHDSSQSADARQLGIRYIESEVPHALPIGLGFSAAQTRLGSGGQTIGAASAEDGWGELLIDAGPLFTLALLGLPVAAAFSSLRDRQGAGGLRQAFGVASIFLVLDGFSFNGVAVEPRSYLFITLATAGVAVTNRPRAGQAQDLEGSTTRRSAPHPARGETFVA